jgi:hypothetical protein
MNYSTAIIILENARSMEIFLNQSGIREVSKELPPYFYSTVSSNLVITNLAPPDVINEFDPASSSKIEVFKYFSLQECIKMLRANATYENFIKKNIKIIKLQTACIDYALSNLQQHIAAGRCFYIGKHERWLPLEQIESTEQKLVSFELAPRFIDSCIVTVGSSLEMTISKAQNATQGTFEQLNLEQAQRYKNKHNYELTKPLEELRDILIELEKRSKRASKFEEISNFVEASKKHTCTLK